MIGGFAIGAAAVASQPEYGSGAGCFGVVYGGDSLAYRVFGSDASDSSGIVFGGDAATGVVFGGDGRTPC